MLLNYMGKGPWSIGHPNPELGENGGKPWKAGQKVIATVTVCIPGVNRIDDAFWKTVKDNVEIKRRVATGNVVILAEKEGNKKKAQEANMSADFEGMDEERACMIVEQCLNDKLLQEWRKTDSRPRILAAVNDQLDKLKLPNRK